MACFLYSLQNHVRTASLYRRQNLPVRHAVSVKALMRIGEYAFLL